MGSSGLRNYAKGRLSADRRKEFLKQESRESSRESVQGVGMKKHSKSGSLDEKGEEEKLGRAKELRCTAIRLIYGGRACERIGRVP